MTELLQQAFDRVSELPQEQQDTFARFIMAELNSEQRWRPVYSARVNIDYRALGVVSGGEIV